jgi:predicted TIM-barrel fold metal-dependent hydrolase
MLPDDLWPVSVNDHVVEPADLWTKRVAAKFRDAAPRVVDGRSSSCAWRFGDLEMEFVGLDQKDRWGPIRRLEDLAPSNFETQARLAAMDRDNVAVHTIMPHACNFAGQFLSQCGDHALWAECVRAYNNFVLEEFCAPASDRLVGVSLLPLADADLSVKEIERTAKLGSRAISLPCNPVGLGLPSYNHASWVKVLDAADANRLAILIHISVDGPLPLEFDPTKPGYRPYQYLVTMANLTALDAACQLIFTPLLAERPQRRIALLEANAGWMPYLEERLDYAVGREMPFKERRGYVYEKAPPTVGRRGSDVARQLMAAFISDPIGIKARHEIGIDRFLWMSDFPHTDSMWPNSRESLQIQLADVPEAEVRRMLDSNARELLGLPQTHRGH